jgi:glycosyltransferase involved in cell wall biosynthesis
MTKRPLITFALFAYNQEQFIHEAVVGAFSQTYSPLEIIISDDFSTDRTFAIMTELVSAYHGPHTIILNRNKMNLGIGSHINLIMDLCHGELIVGAAGDDISFPERTVEIYRAWIDSDEKAFSIDSLYEVIDEYSNLLICQSQLMKLPQDDQLLYFSKTLVNYVSGCTHAWHRSVFEVFGPLPKIILEDVAIPPRSMLLGKVICISKPLVKYRTHSNNVWGTSKKLSACNVLSKIIFFLDDRINICTDVVRCIENKICELSDNSQISELNVILSNIYANRKKLELTKKILTGYPLVRLYYFVIYIRYFRLHWTDGMILVCAFSKSLYILLKNVLLCVQRCNVDKLKVDR